MPSRTRRSDPPRDARLVPNLIPPFIAEAMERGQWQGRFRAASLFVDLSGFTSLTETLMQHSREGAEQLGQCLNGVFGPLVGDAVGRGAIIPLFAGDAFTALFPQRRRGATLHALASALFMRSFLRDGGAGRVLRTPYGDFPLSVRIGLSLGEVAWGIPRCESGATFYFRGSAVDGCSRAIHGAAPGEIVADERIVPSLAEHAVLDAPPEPGVGARVVGPRGQLPVGRDRPSGLPADVVETFLAPRTLEMPEHGEFREVCTIFISFEAPSSAKVLASSAVTLIRAAARRGGSLRQLDFGDKGALFVLLFGAPVAHERMVERAADLLVDLRATGLGAAWRAGITFGTAWVGVGGGPGRSELRVIGDVVNTAARLAMVGTPSRDGDVLATDAVASQVRGTHELAPLGELSLKGKRSGVRAHRLTTRRVATGAATSDSAMVGRGDVLAALEARVAPIFDGRFAGVVTITGDPGIGKTRLLQELAASITGRGGGFLLCTADEVARTSLHPFARLARTLRGDPDGWQDDPWLRALESGDLTGLDARLRLDNTCAAFKTFVRRRAARAPLIIAIDDAQWLDPDSIVLATRLTREMEGVPLALVVAERLGDDREASMSFGSSVWHTRLEVAALPAGSVRDLARTLLGADPAPPLLDLLIRRTEGNPFFVGELVADLRESDLLAVAEDGRIGLAAGRAHKVPATLNAVLIARLDRLVLEVKDVVLAAAVLGMEFEVRVLSRMLRGEQVFERLRAGVEQRILERAGELSYLFRHALLRDAAYGMQARARLRELHAVAAESLVLVHAAALDRHLADVAHHYGQANDLAKEKHYAALAGRHAARHFDHALAERLLARAAELADDPEERCDLLLVRQSSLGTRGDRAAQGRVFDELRPMASRVSPSMQSRIWARHAQFCETVADYRAAVASSDAAVEAARLSGDASRECDALVGRGAHLARTGAYALGIEEIERALALARRTGDGAGEGAALRALGTLLDDRGDLERAERIYVENLRWSRSSPDVGSVGIALVNLGLVLHKTGRQEEGRACQEEALAIFRKTGDRRAESAALLNLAMGLRESEDVDEDHPSGPGTVRARGLFEEALAIKRDIGDRRGEALIGLNLAGLARDSGDLATAETIYRATIAVARELGAVFIVAHTVFHLAGFLDRTGDFEQAHRFGIEALEAMTRIGAVDEIGALLSLSRIERHAGNLGPALERARTAVAVAIRFQDVPRARSAESHLGLALESLGKLDGAAAAYILAGDDGKGDVPTFPAAGLARIAAQRNDPTQALRFAREAIAPIRRSRMSIDRIEAAVSLLPILAAHGSSADDDDRAWLRECVERGAAKMIDGPVRRSFLAARAPGHGW